MRDYFIGFIIAITCSVGLSYFRRAHNKNTYIALCDDKAMEVKATGFETNANGCITFFDGGRANGWICGCSMVALKNPVEEVKK